MTSLTVHPTRKTPKRLRALRVTKHQAIATPRLVHNKLKNQKHEQISQPSARPTLMALDSNSRIEYYKGPKRISI